MLLSLMRMTSISQKLLAEKIDGAVAMIMALDRCIRNKGVSEKSVYDERGV